jgi:O-succinylbenzoic acid--CoA ligase
MFFPHASTFQALSSVPTNPYQPLMNPASFFSDLARFGNEPALIDRASGRVIRYSELEQSLPVIPGGVVATWAKTSLDHLLVLLGSLRQGALVAPISFRLPREEAIRRAQKLGATVFYSRSVGVPPTFEKLPSGGTPALLEQAGTLLHTSGSSGLPRVVWHDLAAHISSAEGSGHRLPLEPGCGWLLQLPLNHVSGFSIAIRCLLSGAAVVFSDPKNLFDDERVTHLSVVSTQLQRLLDSGAPLHRLRAVLAGGGPISTSLVDRAILAGAPLHLTYGMTEAASQICTTDRLLETPTTLHAGTPLPGREVRISKMGEIQIRGAVLAKSSLGPDERWEDLADAEGWFSTGDLGAFTAEGNLVIQGRCDRLIISGGENIQPEPIEAALLEIPGIRRAVVVGKSHHEFGERPVAFLAGDFETSEVRQFLARRLESFAIPEEFHPWPSSIGDDVPKPDFAFFKRLAAGI